MKIAVVGAGLIGQAWAIVFARGGHEVALWDGHEEALKQAPLVIADLVADLQAAGLVTDSGALLSRIRVEHTLEDAIAGAGYVQENLPERLAMKQEIFARLDELADEEVVLASSTSSIPASAFTESLPGRGRCVIAHPVNPPYLVPVVEICGAPWTESQTIQKTWDLMQQVDQQPVHVKKELEGFVLNRLQGALLREAFRLVEQGYVDVDGLDATIRDGLGLRWAFMGPFETIDLNAPGGLADYAQRYGPLYQSIATQQTDTSPWSDALIQAVDGERRARLPKEQLAQRRQWRDRRLMAMAADRARRTAEDN
ncbi:MAG: 3-hydroxyacyl-CoA dehydrogenase [Orrella sp.]